MAIRERKDCGRRYQVYWTNPYTKKRESAFYATSQEAQKADAQIKYRLAWEKESFRPADEPAKEEMSDTTLGGVVYAYLREKQFDRHGVRTVLFHTRPFVDAYGTKDINDITESDLGTSFMRLTGKVKKITAVKRMKDLKTIFRWAVKRKLLRSMPEFPELPHAEYERLVPPTQDEVARMLQAAPPHIQRVIVIGSRIGVRIGGCELFKLQWTDIDWERRCIMVSAAKKNPHEPIREVPIASDLMPVLRRWHDEDVIKGNEFIISWGGHRVTKICGAWKTMLEKAGITRRIRPYDLRHAFATELIAGGADVGTVARLMGHADVTMVLKTYQHVMNTQKRTAVERLPSLPEKFKMCHAECATILQ